MKKRITIKLPIKTAKKRNQPRKSFGKVVNQPSNRAVVRRYSAPTRRGLQSNGRAGVVINHREKFLDLAATPGFVVQYFGDINPGCTTMFPWLSSEIRNWEKFRFRSLRFCYEHMAATNRGGAVYLAVDYNPSDAAPISSAAISAFYNCVMVSPSTDAKCIYKAPGADRVDLRYNSYTAGRLVTVPKDSSINDYSAGKLSLATNSIDTPTGYAPLIGEVWVEYEIELWIQEAAPQPQSDALVNSKRPPPNQPTARYELKTATGLSNASVVEHVASADATLDGFSLFGPSTATIPIPAPLVAQAKAIYEQIRGASGGSYTAANEFAAAGDYLVDFSTDYGANGAVMPSGVVPYPLSVSSNSLWNPSNLIYKLSNLNVLSGSVAQSLMRIVDPNNSAFIAAAFSNGSAGPMANFRGHIESIDRALADALVAGGSIMYENVEDDYSYAPELAAETTFHNLSVEVASAPGDGTEPFGNPPVLSNSYHPMSFAPAVMTNETLVRQSISLLFIGTGLDQLDLTVSGGFSDYVFNYTFNAGHTYLLGQWIATSPIPVGTTLTWAVGSVPASAVISESHTFVSANQLILDS